MVSTSIQLPLDSITACCHCGRQLHLDDVLRYGIVFLFGEKDGYWGLYCDRCKKLSLQHKDLPDLLKIKSTLSYDGESQILQYFSPILSTPLKEDANIRYQYSFPLMSTDIQQHTVTVNNEGLFRPDFYSTYLYAEPVLGETAHVMYMTADDIIANLDTENEEGIRIFPRYFYFDYFLSIVDQFYRDYLIEKSRAQYIEDQLGLNLDRPYPLTWERQDKKIAEFIDILSYRTKRLDLNLPSAAAIWLIKFSDEMAVFQSDNFADADFLQQDDHSGPEPEKFFWDNMRGGFLFDLMDRYVDVFLSRYEAYLKRVDFSVSIIDSLRDEIRAEATTAIRRQRPDREYNSIYSEGDNWTIIFKGNKISGLTNNGFKFIHYLIRNQGKKVSVSELDELDEKSEGGEVSSQQKTVELNKASKENFEIELEDLMDSLAEAEEFGDLGRVSKIQAEIDKLGSYLLESDKGRAFQSEAKKVKGRITKAVERAVKQIKKHDESLFYHLKAALEPINSYTLSYEPNIEINWE